MNTSRLTAGASRFAHLAGLTKGKRGSRAEDDRNDDARADDDEDDDHAEEDDASEDEPKGKKGGKARAEDDHDDDKPKGKSSRRAADDDEDEDPKGKRGSRASEDDDDDQPRSKRSRRAEEDDDDAEDDDDDKEEMNGRSAKASARRREQARISHILGCSAAASNLPLAVSLACETRMTRKEAVAVLKGQADRAPQQERRGAREDRNPQLGGGGGSSKPNAGTGWARSFTKLGLAPRS